MSINCHEPGAELQNQSLETRENHINSNFDFHDTACLFLLGVGYGRNKNNIRYTGFKSSFWFLQENSELAH